MSELEPLNAGYGSSDTLSEEKCTSVTEAVELSPNTSTVSTIVLHAAPLATASSPALYVAQLLSSTLTLVRSSDVKSFVVPSENETDTLTAELVGTEIGDADALSSADATRDWLMLIETDTASGICTCTGASAEPSDTSVQTCQSTCTISLQSAAAPTGTSTVHGSEAERD